MLYGFLLLLTVANIKPYNMNPNFGINHTIKTKAFTGYIESQDGALVFTHMPVGKFANTIVYKHQMVFQQAEQKVIAERAKNVDVAVKIVGKISMMNGKQFILVDTIIILEFEKN